MSLSPERLRRLVKHRERLERLQEANLAFELRQQAERQRALDASRAVRQALFDAGAPATGALELTTLEASAACVVRFGREIDARTAALTHSGERVDAARQVLMERRRDRKAMDTLLDHSLEAERLEERRRERNQLDELAGIRWHNQNRQDSEGGFPWR